LTDAAGRIVFDVAVLNEGGAVADVAETPVPDLTFLLADCKKNGQPVGSPGPSAIHAIPLAPQDAVFCELISAPIADLSVVKDDGIAEVKAGDGAAHTYVITVSNAGPRTATNVTLDDLWPPDFVLRTISSSQGTCSGVASFTCTLGSLAPLASATVTASYTVPAATPLQPHTNAVTVHSTTPDPVPGNNSAIDTDTVVCPFAAATRSTGFWSTHFDLARATWQAIPAAGRRLCSSGTEALGSNELISRGGGAVEQGISVVEGALWSDPVRTAAMVERSPIGRARVHLAQQLMAALLNQQAFGARPPAGLIASARAAYCGESRDAILAVARRLYAFNVSGEGDPFPAWVAPSAPQPAASKAVADKAFWDAMP
jgi:uncharacterized repeat protein (TIGR01451 family)